LLILVAALVVLPGALVAGPDGESAMADFRRLLLGSWTAELTLPNGIRLRDDQNIRADGFASGRTVVFFRDGSMKSSTSYSFAWRIEGRILVSESIIRFPRRENLADHSRDEILRLGPAELVLKDLDNGTVVSYRRPG
jgi:hypothetical protein